MKKEKAVLAPLIVLGLTFSLLLSGCQTQNPADTADADALQESTTLENGEALDTNGKKIALLCSLAGSNDNGYNQTAITGLEELAAQTGIETKVVETTTDYQGTLKTLAESGYGLIFSLEYDFTALIEGVGGEPALAEQFPDTTFVVFNANPNMNEDGTPIYKNVISVMFNVNEASYLAGALSVMVIENNQVLFDDTQYAFTQGVDGRKLGFIGGAQSSGIEVFSFGYMEGVNQAAKDISADTVYTMYTNFDAGFVDTAQGASIAGNFYSEGANIVYTVAGSVGDGVDAKAKEVKKLSIQVDADKDHTQQGSILTSVLKNTNVPVMELGRAYVEDAIAEKGGTEIDYDLASGATGITDLSVISEFIKTDAQAKAKWQEIQEALTELTEKIKSGEIKVTNAQIGETLDVQALSNVKIP